MNTIRIHIDEKPDSQQLQNILYGIAHVVDVETASNDSRELVIEYQYVRTRLGMDFISEQGGERSRAKKHTALFCQAGMSS